MKILSYNPDHDGAIAYLKDGKLLFSIEAEKNSNFRYSPVSSDDVFCTLSELDEIPDVICVGGWWPRNVGSLPYVGYRGDKNDIISEKINFLGREVFYFSSSHERSHLLCAYGLSNLPKGTPCYALIWEGEVGAFYEIDSDFNITLLADVLSEPEQIIDSVHQLRENNYDIAYPYNDDFLDTSNILRNHYFVHRDIGFLKKHKEKMNSLYSVEGVIGAVGGAIFAKTEKYLNVGMDNEEFYGWGLEDGERHCRWFRIRDKKPCTDCVYQWLCPSPSNYELAIGKPNLCNIKK